VIAIGKLRQRLTLQEPVDTDDGAGGVARVWQDVATLWAELKPVSARPRFEGAQAGISVTHQMILRHRDGITSVHRFTLGARIFDIKAISELASQGILQVTVEEQTG
jgi:SPP1 family predicted phage head-tail adaptor